MPIYESVKDVQDKSRCEKKRADVAVHRLMANKGKSIIIPPPSLLLLLVCAGFHKFLLRDTSAFLLFQRPHSQMIAVTPRATLPICGMLQWWLHAATVVRGSSI
jgi:hypothetical protein